MRNDITVGTWVFTGAGINRPFLEKVVRLTPTQIVTNVSKYKKATGYEIGLYNYCTARVLDDIPTPKQIEAAEAQLAKCTADKAERERIEAVCKKAADKLALIIPGVRVERSHVKNDGTPVIRIIAENLTEESVRRLLAQLV